MSTYRGNSPLLTSAFNRTPGQATDGQTYIVVPGGQIPGLNVVVVGGALLSGGPGGGDYDDSDGLGINLARPMAAGTQYDVMSFTGNTSFVPVQGQLAGFRNLLINAQGFVNQRGYTSGAATTVANQYTLDRWRVVVSGQALGYALTSNAYTMTAPAGGVEQVIEGANVYGGTYVLNWQGTATATVNGTAVAKKGTFTLPANTNATVRFSGGTFYLPQLEYGSVATSFEQRPYSTEQDFCERYGRVLTPNGSPDIAAAAFTFSTTQAYGTYTFGRPMRIAPNVSIGGGGSAASFALLGAGGGNIACSGLVFSSAHVRGFSFTATIGTAQAQGAGTVLRFSTSPLLICDAEL